MRTTLNAITAAGTRGVAAVTCRWLQGVLTALLSFVPLTNLTAQGGVLLQDCVEYCGLTLEHLVTLGAGEGLGYVGTPRAVLQLPDGRFVVADRADQDRLKVYSPDGTFLTAVGRRGQGPGDFQVIQEVALLPTDSIEVYDLANRRITVMSTGTFEVGRIARVEVPIQTQARMGGDRRVAVANVPTADGVGLPLHLIGREGTIELSFGAEPPVQDLRNREAMQRDVTRAGPESVWSGHWHRYTIEEWTTGGRLVRTLDRDVPWFTPHSDRGFQREVPPNPGIQAMHQDVQGLLWVIVPIADQDWEEGVGDVRSPLSGRVLPGIVDLESYWDTMIEVIDPPTGRVITSARVDQRMLGFAGDGLIFSYQEAPQREPVIDVWRVRRTIESLE